MKDRMMKLAETIKPNLMTDTPLNDWLFFRVLYMSRPYINAITHCDKCEEKCDVPLERNPNFTRYDILLGTRRKRTFNQKKRISRMNIEVQKLKFSILRSIETIKSSKRINVDDTIYKGLQPDFDTYWDEVKNKVIEISKYFSALDDFAENDHKVPYIACSKYDEMIDIEYLLRLCIALI